MDPSRVNELGSAVLHWLCFQTLCGRAELLSEHYLSQPIGEFLLHHHSGDLKSEYDHPNLNAAARRGRPRQIDFCLCSRDRERLTAAFELKWVSSGSFDKQRVVDDVLRLEALRIPEAQHVFRYFLVAGRAQEFTENFQNAQANLGQGGGRVAFFPELLDFMTNDDKTVIVTSLSAPQRQACDEFSRYYASQLPRRFVTSRIFAESLNGYTVNIWRVRSTKSRAVLPALVDA